MEQLEATTNNDDNNLFRPTKARPFAPIPSPSVRSYNRLQKTTQAFDNCGSRFSPSYAKHARCMEFYRTPPRNRNRPGRRNRTPDSSLMLQPSSKAPSYLDRIEESRHSDCDSHSHNNCKLPLHLKFEQISSTEDTSTRMGSRREDPLDRIECTREYDDASKSKLEARQSKTAQTHSIRNDRDRILSVRHPNQLQTQNVHQIHRKQSHRAPSEASASVSPSNSDSKRSRSLHYQDFQTLRLKYQKYIQNLVAQTDSAEQQPTIDTNDNSPEPIVVVKSRGLLDREIQTGNYSVLDIPLESSRTLALYETDTMPDESGLDVKAHVFQFDAVFSERDSFGDFYSHTVQPCVDSAKKGGLGVILLCGSDDFGKDSTASGIEKKLASDFFCDWDSKPSDDPIIVTHIGLGTNHSDTYIDLLSPMEQHSVEVTESQDGTCNLQGATEETISSSSELLHVWNTVQQNISLEHILRGEAQRAFYSICRIVIPTKTKDKSPGTLYLVRCPEGDQVCTDNTTKGGNEEKKNCTKPTNPLASLMEMIRTIDEKDESIYNQPSCLLTKLIGQAVLAARKELAETRVSLVACVSPCSDDTEDTLSTMLASRQYMTSRKAKASNSKSKKATTSSKAHNTRDEIHASQSISSSESLVLPRQWSPTQLCKWMQRKHFVSEQEDWFEEKQLSGKTVMAMNKEQLQNCFTTDHQTNGGNPKKLFDALRAENDRIARLKVKQKFARQKATQRHYHK